LLPWFAWPPSFSGRHFPLAQTCHAAECGPQRFACRLGDQRSCASRQALAVCCPGHGRSACFLPGLNRYKVAFAERDADS
jgi:hypothetical protein